MKPTRFFSKNQEKQVAKNLSGKVIPNSGATAFAKGDVALDDFLIECKTKVSPCTSFSIKKEWITKQRMETLSMRKDNWAIAFQYEPKGENFYVIDEKTFKMLLDLLNRQ